MLRKITAVLLSLLVLLVAAGCSALPERTKGSETLYNGYMGLTITIPDGWYVKSHSEINLTVTPGESKDPDTFEMTLYNDGGKYYPLILLQNRSQTSNDNHIVLEFFAEDYTGVFSTMREYMDGCEYAYTGDQGDGYYGSLVSRDEVTLNGIPFQKMVVAVNHDENNTAYIEEYYITRVGAMYLTCYTNYWNNPTAKDEAERVLAESFELVPGQTPQQVVSTYVNGYFGIVVEVDEELYYTSVNETNMTRSAIDSADLTGLDASEYDDGGVCYDLIGLQCVSTNTFGDHAEMGLYVEDYDDMTIDEYFDATEAYYVNDDETQGYTCTVAARDTATVNGRQYHRLVFSIELDSGETYTEENYVCEVQGMFFIAYLQYITGDADTHDDAMAMLETFHFGDLPDDGLTGLI